MSIKTSQTIHAEQRYKPESLFHDKIKKKIGFSLNGIIPRPLPEILYYIIVSVYKTFSLWKEPNWLS